MYPGVLNTGGPARYGHPALFGALPEPWLPALAEPKETGAEVPQAVKDALLVVDLRRGWRNLKRAAKQGINLGGDNEGESSEGGRRRPRATSWGSMPSEEDPSRAWRGSESSAAPSPRREDLLSDEEDDLDEEDEHGNIPARCVCFLDVTSHSC